MGTGDGNVHELQVSLQIQRHDLLLIDGCARVLAIQRGRVRDDAKL